VSKHEGKRSFGRPRRTCENNIKMNVKEVNERLRNSLKNYNRKTRRKDTKM
jgi:hypothetical protein